MLFDTVLSTLMLHHLPRAARQQSACEMRRVLKPGGRVLAVDFGKATGDRKGLIEHFHRHDRVDLLDIVKLLSAEGFQIVERGAVGVRDLNFDLQRPDDRSTTSACVVAHGGYWSWSWSSLLSTPLFCTTGCRTWHYRRCYWRPRSWYW